MGLAQHRIGGRPSPLPLDVALLARSLRAALPEAILGFLLGSTVGGTVGPHSDIDLPSSLDRTDVARFRLHAAEVTEFLIQRVDADVAILNGPNRSSARGAPRPTVVLRGR